MQLSIMDQNTPNAAEIPVVTSLSALPFHVLTCKNRYPTSTNTLSPATTTPNLHRSRKHDRPV
jgi:hypothetical protein